MEEGQRRTAKYQFLRLEVKVLILVVMEEGQRHSYQLPPVNEYKSVLILVVMEEGQRLRLRQVLPMG